MKPLQQRTRLETDPCGQHLPCAKRGDQRLRLAGPLRLAHDLPGRIDTLTLTLSTDTSIPA